MQQMQRAGMCHIPGFNNENGIYVSGATNMSAEITEYMEHLSKNAAENQK